MPYNKNLQASLAKINQEIIKECTSKSALAKQVCQHLLSLNGKRLRAQLTLIATGVCQKPICEGEQLAIIVEWLHAATLLHDDVIDNAEMRRHKLSANKVWGNSISILSGDYLYALAFKSISTIKNHQITATLAESTAEIIEGEIKQLENRFKLYQNIDEYAATITGKTATLFATAAKLPAILFNASPKTLSALNDFGHYFGLAYQMIDDIQDYSQSSSQIGKTQYQDLIAGTCTLPLIIASNSSDQTTKQAISLALKGCSKSQQKVIAIFNDNPQIIITSIRHAIKFQNQAIDALNNLEESVYKTMLIDLMAQATTKINKQLLKKAIN